LLEIPKDFLYPLTSTQPVLQKKIQFIDTDTMNKICIQYNFKNIYLQIQRIFRIFTNKIDLKSKLKHTDKYKKYD